MEKLDPVIKAKWITGLRDREVYIQTTDTLYNPKKGDGRLAMCCLGVLEHVCGNSLDTLEGNGEPYDLEKSYSPESIINDVDNVTSRLMSMNDDEGKSFEEIADFIDKNL